MKHATNDKTYFKPGDRVLIDVWGSYSERIEPTVPGTIMDVTKNQYYVCPDWMAPQYVWHHCVITEPASQTKPLYYLTYPEDQTGNDDGVLVKRRMTYEEVIRCNQDLEGTGKQWVK